jgi:integrase
MATHYPEALAAPLERIDRFRRSDLSLGDLKSAIGQHREGFRDHAIFAVALGTGLREHKIAALDVGDVLRDDGRVRHRIALRTFKRSSADPATQQVFIADSNLYLERSKAVGWPAGAVALRRSGRTSPAAFGTLNG